MFNKLFKSVFALAKEFFSAFTSDESQEVVKTVVKPSAFQWSVDNTYSINNQHHYLLDNVSNSQSTFINSNIFPDFTPYPSPDSSVSDLSQRLLEEARRYPVDFSREEIY